MRILYHFAFAENFQIILFPGKFVIRRRMGKDFNFPIGMLSSRQNLNETA